MSITSITIENFKGIRDRVTIDLKPITLLFGPNSAGKSTIIQALHYAWEVIGRHYLDPNFTEFGGREMDLGGFENLVYGHDLSRSISIRVDMDLQGKSLPAYGDPQKLVWDETASLGETESMFDENINIYQWHIEGKKISSMWIEIRVSWCEESKNFRVSSYDVGLNGELIAKVKKIADTNKVNVTYINFFHPLLVSINNNIEEEKNSYLFDLLADFIREIGIEPDNWINNDAFSSEHYNQFVEKIKKFPMILEKKDALYDALNDEIIEKLKSLTDNNDPQIIEKKSELMEEHIEVFNRNREELYSRFLPYEFLFFCFEAFGIESINNELNIECIGLKDALPNWGTPFRLKFKSEASKYFSEALESAILQFIIGPGQLIKDELQKLSYLGPIRSRIPRNYVPNRYVEKRNWPDGLAAWDVLHKKEEEIVKQTDFWMADRLNSGYHITRKTYKEIDVDRLAEKKADLQAIYNAAPAKTRLFLMDQKSGVEVQPPDVGVGISQVIPVIVSALYFKDGIVTIEQPELHIHPALQVTLGDLFISQIPEKSPCFILETHSEHIILRLLRRIRETHEKKLPDGMTGLTPDQLVVHYIESGPDGVKISTLEIDETGEFKNEWPHGFFEEREEELFY